MVVPSRFIIAIACRAFCASYRVVLLGDRCRAEPTGGPGPGSAALWWYAGSLLRHTLFGHISGSPRATPASPASYFQWLRADTGVPDKGGGSAGSGGAGPGGGGGRRNERQTVCLQTECCPILRGAPTSAILSTNWLWAKEVVIARMPCRRGAAALGREEALRYAREALMGRVQRAGHCRCAMHAKSGVADADGDPRPCWGALMGWAECSRQDIAGALLAEVTHDLRFLQSVAETREAVHRRGRWHCGGSPRVAVGPCICCARR